MEAAVQSALNTHCGLVLHHLANVGDAHGALLLQDGRTRLPHGPRRRWVGGSPAGRQTIMRSMCYSHACPMPRSPALLVVLQRGDFKVPAQWFAVGRQKVKPAGVMPRCMVAWLSGADPMQVSQWQPAGPTVPPPIRTISNRLENSPVAAHVELALGVDQSVQRLVAHHTHQRLRLQVAMAGNTNGHARG